MAISNEIELKEYFLNHEYPSYTRDNFDRFLEKERHHFSFKRIHITGTNGKGSCANYIRQIYIKHGYKVGFYNSPYFYSPLEMISINNDVISLERYLEILNKFADSFEKYHLTSFEIQTFIAYYYFEQSNIDIAVIEVGMGGDIDATNVLDTPLLAIITSISLEHTAFLGRTTSEIADSKAGIITGKCKVLVGKVDDDALYSIQRVSKQTRSDLKIVDEIYDIATYLNKLTFTYPPYKDITLSTSALYQCKNAALAIDAVNLIKDDFPISEKDIREGLLTSNLPSRFEWVKDNIVVDGGHNPEAIENLLNSLEKVNNKPIHCVFAAFRDKNIASMLSLLSRDCDSVLLTTFDHKRAKTEEEYFIYLGDFEFEGDYKNAIDKVVEKYPNDLILITGSLAFSALARKYLLEKK